MSVPFATWDSAFFGGEIGFGATPGKTLDVLKYFEITAIIVDIK